MSKYLKKPVDSLNYIANSPLRSGTGVDDPVVCDGKTIHAATAVRTGAGAIPLNTSIVEIVSTGTNALTLANGEEGQILYVVVVTDGGSAVITPANFAQGTTLTLAEAGDACTLLFTAGKWYAVGQQGVAIA